ncbi:MAGE protein [Xylaria nigripes]|nr:MAGE protein [Xylaria nigripes]
MAPPTQRRRRTGHQEQEEDIPRHRRQSRRDPESDDASEISEGEADEDVDMDTSSGPDSISDDQLVKKLVRYALACEYVLGPHGRSFRRVFDAAQEHLQRVFGMEMVELPLREKRTLKDKQSEWDPSLRNYVSSYPYAFLFWVSKERADRRVNFMNLEAVKRGASQVSASSRQYILMSTLPREFRAQPIIGPSRVPSTADEAAYVAFYTIIISIITMSGGEVSEMKLRRYLTRLNASQNLPMDKTENVLQKLIRQGYLDKVIERVEGDEDSITWCVGPRGKVEVSSQSIAQVVTEVWGDTPDDFDKKLEKSLGVQKTRPGRSANRDRSEEASG